MPNQDFTIQIKSKTPATKRTTRLAGERANRSVNIQKVDTMTIEVMNTGEVKHWKESSKMKDYLANIWGSVDGRGDFSNKEVN